MFKKCVRKVTGGIGRMFRAGSSEVDEHDLGAAPPREVQRVEVRRKRRGSSSFWLLAALAALLVSFLGAVPAFAGGPPAMTAIEFPVDTASIVTAVVAAGGAILVLVFAWKVGFGLVKKLVRRLSGAI